MNAACLIQTTPIDIAAAISIVPGIDIVPAYVNARPGTFQQSCTGRLPAESSFLNGLSHTIHINNERHSLNC